MRWAFLLCVLSLPVSAPIFAQHRHGHAMSMTDSVTWRMPPMGPAMPMLPGIQDALPPTGPYLPGSRLRVTDVPEAEPRRIVPLADGDTLKLQATLVRRTLQGKSFIMYGYNRQYPGPLLHVKRGSTVVVHFTNDIELPTTVHWHGLRLDNRFDGVAGLTQDVVKSGESFTYEVRFPDTGIYWYHPHVREDIQQDLGLYGNLLVEPDTDDYWGPVHRDEVVVLDDILIDEHGLIPWGEDVPTHTLMGRFGNVMLTNGATDYGLTVRRGEVVRFFLTNVANSRTFNVTFGGAPIKIVASDVSKFEHEIRVESVPIAPAERYVAEVRFDEPGRIAITNSIQAINHFRGEFYPHVDTLAMVTVQPEPAAPDLSDAFDRLRSNHDVARDIDRLRPWFDAPPDKTLDLTLRVKNLPVAVMMAMEIDTLFVPPMEWNDAMPMMNWLSTARQVTWILRERSTGLENMHIGWEFDVGDAVKLRLFNDPKSFHPMNHPFHVHGQRFLVLELDGVRSRNMVWKDTAVIPVGSTMDILVEMSNPGDWMAHCHIAEHLDAGMMLHFTVRDVPQAQ